LQCLDRPADPAFVEPKASDEGLLRKGTIAQQFIENVAANRLAAIHACCALALVAHEQAHDLAEKLCSVLFAAHIRECCW